MSRLRSRPGEDMSTTSPDISPRGGRDRCHTGIEQMSSKVHMVAVCEINDLLVGAPLPAYLGRMPTWSRQRRYLSDRKQRVVIQGATSTCGKSPLAGVPQGSVLGPTLFILYINDLATSRTHCLANLFADDTSLSFSHHSVQRVVATLNRELSTVSTWLSTWKLEANIDKCKVMFITTRTLPQPIPPVTLGGTVLQVVTSHKHLGVTLTNTLSWSQHIEVISNKARRSLGLLCALRRKIPQNLLLRLYITITRPTLEYADIVWAGLTLRDQRTLESVQYQTARLISGHFGIPYPSYNSLYTELSLPSLQFRRKFHTAVTMYKLLNGRCPPHLQSLLPRARASATESRYPLRNREVALESHCVRDAGKPVRNHFPKWFGIEGLSMRFGAFRWSHLKPASAETT
ncbi:hypothetical protein Bbelb_137210 [Branchiostoma belcheri]|nr:hypothetical protein Bbelb_137210 [Branchiostoma belcheri]